MKPRDMMSTRNSSIAANKVVMTTQSSVNDQGKELAEEIIHPQVPS